MMRRFDRRELLRKLDRLEDGRIRVANHAWTCCLCAGQVLRGAEFLHAGTTARAHLICFFEAMASVGVSDPVLEISRPYVRVTVRL